MLQFTGLGFYESANTPRTTNSGHELLQFTISTYDKKGNTYSVDCIAFGDLVEKVQGYNPGDIIYVNGTIKARPRRMDNGTEFHPPSLMVNSVQRYQVANKSSQNSQSQDSEQINLEEVPF